MLTPSFLVAKKALSLYLLAQTRFIVAHARWKSEAGIPNLINCSRK